MWAWAYSVGCKYCYEYICIYFVMFISTPRIGPKERRPTFSHTRELGSQQAARLRTIKKRMKKVLKFLKLLMKNSGKNW